MPPVDDVLDRGITMCETSSPYIGLDMFGPNRTAVDKYRTFVMFKLCSLTLARLNYRTHCSVEPLETAPMVGRAFQSEMTEPLEFLSTRFAVSTFSKDYGAETMNYTHLVHYWLRTKRRESVEREDSARLNILRS